MKKRFTNEEDRILRQLVGKYGENSWKRISREMIGRSERQVKDRWVFYLNPFIINIDWNSQEDALLVEKCSLYGPRWTLLAQFFPGRTPISVKNRYKRLQSRANVNVSCSDPSIQNAKPNTISINDLISNDNLENQNNNLEVKVFKY